MVNGIRLLAAHGLVTRAGSRYGLARQHPAAAEAVALGLRLPSPEAAIRVVLRASDSIEFAVADEDGFVVGIRVSPTAVSLAALEASLATIRRDRPELPPILRFETPELARILHSAMGLRRRVASATLVKGTHLPVGP